MDGADLPEVVRPNCPITTDADSPKAVFAARHLADLRTKKILRAQLVSVVLDPLSSW
jgi:hypothetical protein